MTLEQAMREIPIVAILRGVRPDEVGRHGEALLACGVRAIEVPLNSPDPFVSIKALASQLGLRAVVGAGTVLSADDVDRVADAGGRIIVAPNVEASVIARALALGLTPLPGFMTATEALTALKVGASALKLFPAALLGPAHLTALRAVLPSEAKIFAVGGVKAEELMIWRKAGAAGLGLGSELYRVGQHPEETLMRARAAVAAMSGALDQM
jgi:2-dehydro-3-deoxyphosphogalactonate aldolase